jgi:hypothetical protein
MTPLVNALHTSNVTLSKKLSSSYNATGLTYLNFRIL